MPSEQRLQPHRRPPRVPRLMTAAVLVSLLGPSAPSLASDAPPPPDLRLEWRGGSRQAPPIRGEAGDAVSVDYVIRNVGGRDAFAVIVNVFTALGSQGEPRRVKPGPEAGESLRRDLTLALAVGMRELCLTARLQNLELADPDDPNPDDNRLCRAVEVVPRSPDATAAVVAARRSRTTTTEGRAEPRSKARRNGT